MVDALQAPDSGDRRAALVHFVEQVGAEDAEAYAALWTPWRPRTAEPGAALNPGNSRTGGGYRTPWGRLSGVSALAFTLLAILLAGPVACAAVQGRLAAAGPARAAIVLWQSIATAAVLSRLQRRTGDRSRLFVPGPDGADRGLDAADRHVPADGARLAAGSGRSSSCC